MSYEWLVKNIFKKQKTSLKLEQQRKPRPRISSVSEAVSKTILRVYGSIA